MSLHSIIIDIQDALKTLSLSQKQSNVFNKQREAGAQMMLKGAIKRLLDETRHNPEAFKLAQQLEHSSPNEMREFVEQLAELAVDEKEDRISEPFVPADIREDVFADLREINLCIKSNCYRSAVILCGRVLETALHRKYYEATQQDLLEKAPGIGLGNLIAKLAEKGIKLDPGLPNQIHLINQVRVFSVHTKQDAFVPSKMQAEAIVLYTIDVLNKLFKSSK